MTEGTKEIWSSGVKCSLMIPEFDFSKFQIYAANCICGWSKIFSSKDEFSGICPQCDMDLGWLVELWTDYVQRTPADEISPVNYEAFVSKERRKRKFAGRRL